MALTTVKGAVLNRGINVKDYGAIGDGVTDDTASLRAAATYVGTNGGKLIFPTGNYLISNDLQIPLVGAPDIILEGHEATITAAAGFPAGKLVITTGTVTGGRFTFSGFTLDATNVPNSGAGEANDAIYVANELDEVTISNCHIFAGTDYATAGSDSGIFVASALKITLDNNRIIGFPDAGIYISGDATGLIGENCYVANNYIEECSVGITTKRQFKRNTNVNNFVKKCPNGIAQGDTVTLLPGDGGLIANNQVVNCDRGIELRVDNGGIVSNNRVIDSGYNTSSTTITGIYISGSDNSVVEGNSIVGLLSGITKASGMDGISLIRRTIDAVNYDCDSSLVSGNLVEGFHTGVRMDANSTNSKILNNVGVNCTADYVTAGTYYLTDGDRMYMSNDSYTFFNTIAATGRTSYGHESPQRKHHFADGYANGSSANGGVTGTSYLYESSATQVVNYVCPTSNQTRLVFGDPTNNNMADFRFDASNDKFSFNGAADVLMGSNSVANSSTTTGGTGSAGAGNQYVELTIGGTTYKVLHDGTV